MRTWYLVGRKPHTRAEGVGAETPQAARV
jgi:hypothetical protein